MMNFLLSIFVFSCGEEQNEDSVNETKEACIDEDNDGICVDLDCDDGNAQIGSILLYDNCDDVNGQSPEDIANNVDADNDGVTVGEGDCDDSDASIYPILDENSEDTEDHDIWYDGIDSNCDGKNDYDKDEDGYVEEQYFAQIGVAEDDKLPIGDCNDEDASIHIDADELCDGIDNDCDVIVPDNEIDNDSDGYVECEFDQTLWNGDENVFDGNDCNDDNLLAYPGATEICDGIDTDCDQTVPENEIDNDNDGQVECTIDDTGWNGSENVASGDDCDDDNPNTYLGAAEICDGIVNDCLGGDVPEIEIDNDGDGYVECGYDQTLWNGDENVVGGEDCVDDNLLAYPNATEFCDGIDTDCNGNIPEDETDDDSDGYIECEFDQTLWNGDENVVGGEDCNDNDTTVRPNGAEICDGIINNCGSNLPPEENDQDNDGYVECTFHESGWDGDENIDGGGDCDDTNPNTYEGATEICDGLVNDCLGGDEPEDETDDDGDGYVECEYDEEIWDGDSNIVGGGDCNDDNDNVKPGAFEECDGEDTDCDVIVPDNEIDNDSDGYVECKFDETMWSGDSNVVGGDDCDDTNPNTYEGATEICDGLVNECFGTLPENEVDNDSDGYVECTISEWNGDSNVVGGDDCDDTNPNTYEGATEICDGLVNECNSTLPENEVDNDGDKYVECEYDEEIWDGNMNILGGGDCDDTLTAIRPSAEETYYDGVDQNCDGLNDYDMDNDEYVPEGMCGKGSIGEEDCPDDCIYTCYDIYLEDDAANAFIITVGSTQVSIQSDECYTDTFFDDTYCVANRQVCLIGAHTITFSNMLNSNGYFFQITTEQNTEFYRSSEDLTNSSFQSLYTDLQDCSACDISDCENPDCNDTVDTVHPNGFEECDGYDNDCNGEIDETHAVDEVYDPPFSIDNDHDGWPAEVSSGCFTEAYGQVHFSHFDSDTYPIGDCNDTNNAQYPYANKSSLDTNQNCDELETSYQAECEGFLWNGSSVKTGAPISGDVYYLICDVDINNNVSWEQAAEACINTNLYDGPPTFASQNEFNAFTFNMALLSSYFSPYETAIPIGYTSYEPLSYTNNNGEWNYITGDLKWYDGLVGTSYAPETSGSSNLPLCTHAILGDNDSYDFVTSRCNVENTTVGTIACSKRFE